jgi:phage virion morphogenesis protein
MAELLKIDIDDQELLAALRPVIDALDDPTELLESMGAVMARNVELRFETKTDPNGEPWAPLADSTREQYERRYKGSIPGSLLERNRHMRASLDHQVVGDVLEVGFGEAYAGYHETGRKDGKMPRRGLLAGDWQTGELGADDRADLVAEIEQFLAARL